MPLFSRRNDIPSDVYIYALSENTRRRLFHALQAHFESGNTSWDVSFSDSLAQMRSKLLQTYGSLRCSSFAATRISGDPVVEHFFSCTHEEVMDFLVFCFETNRSFGGQPTVELINRILSEENVGFELSDYSETLAPEAPPAGRVRIPGRRIIRQLPKAIRKDEKILHDQVVKPCLNALSDPRFRTASDELLAAFAEHGKGKHGDAITDAGAAFESVLKIICTAKHWPYDKEKATCSTLLEICRVEGLFHGFYRSVLEGTATIRNKVGDAHGKGPNPEYPATKELAEHMLYNVCNNINLVISLAKL